MQYKDEEIKDDHAVTYISVSHTRFTV